MNARVFLALMVEIAQMKLEITLVIVPLQLDLLEETAREVFLLSVDFHVFMTNSRTSSNFYSLTS